MTRFPIYRFALILTIMLIASCNRNLHHKIQKTNKSLMGQTAPSDMVFISGNDFVSSFYIGVSEEPNINYVIYLKWLIAVFGNDYPEKVFEALPHKPNGDKTCSLNDPFIQSYLTNPAFAYAPILNLDWNQINQYMHWKTDVLNEEILIKTGLLYMNPNQQNEPFTTEAYLLGQYETGVKEYLESSNPFEAGGKKQMGKRTPSSNDGICFLGFRLPTEKEWEYASQSKFAAELKSSTKKVNT